MVPQMLGQLAAQFLEDLHGLYNYLLILGSQETGPEIDLILLFYYHLYHTGLFIEYVLLPEDQDQYLFDLAVDRVEVLASHEQLQQVFG